MSQVSLTLDDYGTAKVTSTRVKLARNSRATRATRVRSKLLAVEYPVKITNCWVGENVNDWIALNSSASVLFRKMRSIDRNGGRVRLTISIFLGKLRLNLCKMRQKVVNLSIIAKMPKLLPHKLLLQFSLAQCIKQNNSLKLHEWLLFAQSIL